MKTISIEKSLELFSEALARLSNDRLALSDDDLSYEIFEELPTDAHSFLHEWTVDRLINGKLIPPSIRNDVLTLRARIEHLLSTKSTLSEYRNNNEWISLRKQAEDIDRKIKSFRKHEQKD